SRPGESGPRLASCHPGRAAGGRLRGRTILQKAVAAIDVDILYALITRANRTDAGVPLPAGVRPGGAGLRINVLHPCDQSHNADRADESALHQIASLLTSKCRNANCYHRTE